MSQAPAPIVVVDDDPDTVEFLCDYLRSLGLRGVSCRVGPQVAACIVHHAPRLVMLDVELGDLTDIEVFHTLRADATTRQVPVIFFTGNADKLRTDLPDYRAHAAALVVKPDLPGLQAAIHAVVPHHA